MQSTSSSVHADSLRVCSLCSLIRTGAGISNQKKQIVSEKPGEKMVFSRGRALTPELGTLLNSKCLKMGKGDLFAPFV